MNKLKSEKKLEQLEEKEVKIKSPNFFTSLITGSFLAKDNVVGALPFVLFLSLYSKWI